MPRFITTARVSATFDFFLNLIELRRLRSRDIPRILDWYSDAAVFAGGGPAARQARQDKGDLVHEATHFLDATTTIWGLEFNARKLRAAKLSNGDPKHESLSVFMLNMAEIDAHKARHSILLQSPALHECTLHHRVLQDERWGPLIELEYWHEGAPVLKVPLTMLAVIEGHAHANEALSLLDDAALITSQEERQREREKIEQAFTVSLDKRESSEYTVLLHLTNLHFPDLSLRDRLRFFSALVRLTLDLDAFQMSSLADTLEATFENRLDGTSATLDMHRGTSRAIATFKLIGIVHILTGPANGGQRDAAVLCDPVRLEALLVDNGVMMPEAGRQLEVDFYVSEIQTYSDYLDANLVPWSVALNRPLATEQPCAAIFRKLALPDFTFEGERATLRLPLHLDIDVRTLPRSQTESLERLHRTYRRAHVSKFFVRLE